jgi:alpha-amylase
MKKLKLIIGTHNSQPVGSYDYVFERAYQEAYKPFLTIFYNYSDIPITLYYSGTLLQWLEDHHPEFLMLLDDMVKQKQVDLLSGGFYDPIFPIIPPSDRIGQIEKLTTYLRKKFGKRPAGSWVTELVWEPCLTSMFKTSGINYIFLDESHFEAIGFSGVQLYQPCITEDQGKTLIVYPISSSLGDRLIYE